MTPEFSNYHHEKELLLMDGLDFYIFDFKWKQFDGEEQKFAEIKLYNTSVSDLPQNPEYLNEDLLRQELNN